MDWKRTTASKLLEHLHCRPRIQRDGEQQEKNCSVKAKIRSNRLLLQHMLEKRHGGNRTHGREEGAEAEREKKRRRSGRQFNIPLIFVPITKDALFIASPLAFFFFLVSSAGTGVTYFRSRAERAAA